MMRKTFSRFAVAAASAAATPAKSVPLADLIKGSSNPAELHREVTMLHTKNIVDISCWKNLSAAVRLSLSLSAELTSILNKAVADNTVVTSPKRVAILFASHHAAAETHAKTLGTYAASRGLTPLVCSMNEGVQLLASTRPPEYAVFICATTGRGETPANAKGFFKAIEKGTLNLEGLQYAILGLGNSHTTTFNAVGTSLEGALQKLKAKCILPTQTSCEVSDRGHEAGFRSWMKDLWPVLGAPSAPQLALQPTYKATTVYGNPGKAIRHSIRPGFFPAVMHQNTLLSAYNYEPRQRLIGFDIDVIVQEQVFGREVEITDHVEIMPTNPQSLVDRALRRLNIDGDSMVEITPLAGALPSFFAFHKLTQRTILTEIVDLSHQPTRSSLEVLASLAGDDAERNTLLDLANNLKPGNAYEALTTSGVFTMIDALEKFPSVNLTLGQLMTIAPVIAPRTYSIVSDHSKGKHARFDMLCAVPTRESNGVKHTGLCSGMLDRMLPGETMNIRFVSSSSKLAKDSSDVLYIALGTGVGSVRSALQRRALAKASGKTVGKAHLFYGFRHSGKDCLFTDEFEVMKRDGLLTTTYVASRDGPTFVSPLDSITPKEVEGFLGDNCEVVFCGLGGTVPSLVEAALVRSGVNVAALRASGRYHEEYFTADLDTENLIKSEAAAKKKA